METGEQLNGKDKKRQLKAYSLEFINRPKEELNLPPYPQSNSVEFWFYFTKYTILQGFIKKKKKIVE